MVRLPRSAHAVRIVQYSSIKDLFLFHFSGAWAESEAVGVCVLTFRIFVGRAKWSTWEPRRVVSVWTNYSRRIRPGR